MQLFEAAAVSRENFFTPLDDQTLEQCYGQYLLLCREGRIKSDPLRGIINRYLDLSPQGMVIAEQKLLSEIAKRHYKGVQFPETDE